MIVSDRRVNLSVAEIDWEEILSEQEDSNGDRFEA